MWRRSRAREVALQVLYEDDMNPRHSMVASNDFVRRRLNREANLVDFANSLVAGVRLNRRYLDEELQRRTENWSLKRMAVTDRNVLRIGAFEILFTETPERVVIDEAVDLARRFGTHQSAHFVNGVLDCFLKKAQDTE
ncbi:MAG: transcription antitermination factor NusB [Planctomycetota bacterium]